MYVRKLKKKLAEMISDYSVDSTRNSVVVDADIGKSQAQTENTTATSIIAVDANIDYDYEIVDEMQSLLTYFEFEENS